MCGAHVNPPLAVSFDPPAKNPAAGKTDCTCAVCIDDGQFQIAVEWRGRYFVPHEVTPKKSEARLKHLCWICLAISGQEFEDSSQRRSDAPLNHAF
jgi:hypothetical protein